MIPELFNTWRFLRRHPLTTKQPMVALRHYLRWQAGSRLVDGAVAVDFVNGARLLVRPGMTGATGNVYAGLHDFRDMAFVLHALRAEDLFVDVGANVGSYTILAARGVGSRVVTFEPAAATFASLMDNVRLNAVEPRVDARMACLGRVQGQVSITTNCDTTNHVVAESWSDQAIEHVPQLRLDDVLDETNPFLIKLDVEGYELEVLRGSERVLADRRLHAIIIEVNNGGVNHAQPVGEPERIIRSIGFERVSYDPYRRCLTEWRHRTASDSNNALFVRDRRVVEERVESAPPFKLTGQRI